MFPLTSQYGKAVSLSSEMTIAQRSAALRCATFTAIVLSTAAVSACLLAFPCLYNLVQGLNEEIENEAMFCRSRSRDLWKRYVDIKLRTESPSTNAMPSGNTSSHWYSNLIGKKATSLSFTNEVMDHVIAKRQTYGQPPEPYGGGGGILPVVEMFCCTCRVGQPGHPGNPGSTGRRGVNGLMGRPGNNGRPARSSQPTNIFPPQCPCEADNGPRGNRGPTGARGLPGPDGEPGKLGRPGSDGIKGQPGSLGNPGRGGEKGNRGQPGNTRRAQGRPGSNGNPGSNGLPGRDGSPGKEGVPGTPGERGRPGESGREGSPGTNGFKGPPGAPGYSGPPGSCDHCPRSRLAPGY